MNGQAGGVVRAKDWANTVTTTNRMSMVHVGDAAAVIIKTENIVKYIP